MIRQKQSHMKPGNIALFDVQASRTQSSYPTCILHAPWVSLKGPFLCPSSPAVHGKGHYTSKSQLWQKFTVSHRAPDTNICTIIKTSLGMMLNYIEPNYV